MTAVPTTASAPPDPATNATAKKWKRRVLIAGALLPFICKALPVDYQGPCNAIVQLCTGGLFSL